MIQKANESVFKELDLIKFIQRQRLTTFTTLATFNSRQKFVADKLATKIIRESSDLCDNSEDDFELEQENVLDIEHHSEKIFRSKDIIDQRLIRAYQAKRWLEDYKYNNGKSSAFEEIEILFERMKNNEVIVDENDLNRKSAARLSARQSALELGSQRGSFLKFGNKQE